MPTTAAKRSRTRASAATRTGPRRRTQTQPDVIALIKTDHATVNQLFRRYERLGQRAYKSRAQLAERLIKELSVHAAVEEQVLYPNARAAIPQGEQLVDEAISEHQTMKESLAELEKCPPDSDRFDQLVTALRDEVRHHVKEEEAPNGILSELRKHASRDELRQMGTMTRAAKRAAPTHPHPKAPATPPGNIVIGAAAAVIDRARDKLAKRA